MRCKAILFVRHAAGGSQVKKSSQKGLGKPLEIQWTKGFEIRVAIDRGTVVISANREGLLSLAGQLAALAEESPGSHIHYDTYNSLEEGSADVIIGKM